MKKIIIWSIVFVSVFVFIGLTDNTSKILEVNYCWDSEGTPFIMPNPNCTTYPSQN